MSFFIVEYNMSGISLLLSAARGVYIPHDFVNNFELDKWHIDPKYVSLLSSPDDEWYWDNWDVVCGNAYFVDELGNKWTLYQDGDLFALCYELLTEEERVNFGFDE